MLETFPYTLPLAGGLLIGLAATLLLLSLGRIAGISGILWSTVSAQPDNLWRWTFLLGLVAAPWLYHTLAAVPVPTASGLEWWWAVAGGLLVGFGTKLGSGCTSGHGVCGLGRLSPRSAVAVLTFLITAFITVFIIRHG